MPFVAFESVTTRLERTNGRLWILCVVLTVLLFATNLAWVIYDNQYIDEMSVEQEVDTGMGDAFITGIGDLNYGEDKANSN